MTKLHKVNNNGTLSIILPKSETSVWNAGDEVSVETVGTDVILVLRVSDANTYALKKSYLEILDRIAQYIDLNKSHYKNMQELFNADEQTLKNELKNGLLKLIQQF